MTPTRYSAILPESILDTSCATVQDGHMANKAHAVARLAEALYGSEDALAAEIGQQRELGRSWQNIRDDLLLQSGLAISYKTLTRWWDRRQVVADSLAPTEVESAPAAESAHVVAHPSVMRDSAALSWAVNA